MRAARQVPASAPIPDRGGALAIGIARHPIAAATVVLLANLLLKLPTVGVDSIWLDEAVSLQVTLEPISISTFATRDATPPLHYLLLSLWGRLFGASLESARTLSVLLSSATAAVLFDLARRHLGVETALISAALFLTSGIQLYFAQEARTYALVGLLCVLSFHLFLGLFSRPSKTRAVALAAVNVALVFSHYVAVFALAAQLAAALLKGRREATALRYYVASQVGAGASFVAGFTFLDLQSVAAQASWIPPPKLGQIRYILKRFAGSSALLVLYGCVLLGTPILRRLRPSGARIPSFAFSTIALWALLPLALAYAASLLQPMLLDRYVLYASLGLYLLVGSAIALAPLPGWARASVAGVLVVLASAAAITEPIQRQDWRRGVAIAKQEEANGATIVAARRVHYRPLAYYLDPDAFRDPAHTIERLQGRGVVIADTLEDLMLRPGRYVLLLAPDSPLAPVDASAWFAGRGLRVARTENLNGLTLLVLEPRSTG